MPYTQYPRSDLDYASVRLRLVGTRVVAPDKSHTNEDTDGLTHNRPVRDTPEFCKNEAATTFELFYDLWFVANLSIFSSVHDITSEEALLSYIGYYVLLWTTWLMTTMYDVRFTADSVLERCCKAVHLGVMVGFAVIGTSFEPDAQIKAVFRATSLFLMFSRLALTLQYGLVAWQIRKYVDGRRPMFVTAALHFVAAIIYLGLSFRFEGGKNSRVYLVWYIVGIVEIKLHLAFSQLSEVLTFLGTHFGERLNLLTLIVLGEGAMILAKNVTLVVKDTYLKDPGLSLWSSSLIGIVTSSAALIYIIFQLYFDWMQEEHSMSKRHQVWWAGLHLPFHISLVLLLEGSNQFIIWARVSESVDAAVTKLLQVKDSVSDSPTSAEVSDALGKIVKPFITKYQPAEVLETWIGVNETLADISNLPDYLWTDDNVSEDDPELVHWWNYVLELLYTMVNSIYNAFDIEAPEEETGSENLAEHGEYVQTRATQALGNRFKLVFIYAFACAGIVLLYLTFMHVLSKRKGWTPFNIFRTAICIALSLGLALTALLTLNENYVETFMGSPWMLPTITISYFVVLILTHVPHPPSFGLGNFKRGAYEEVEEQTAFRKAYPLTDVSRDVRERGDGHHMAGFEDRRSGYTSTDIDMPVTPGLTPGYGVPEDNRRSSYVSAETVSSQGSPEHGDIDRTHTRHQSMGPQDWERKH
ncbi:hypothetical protein BJ170DRAFT_355338 [Xylariales sp. AK1849]|nr:hypothetical protein BJ170DRAFT_355338 [Xylariales sp. AK1849]